MSSFQQFTSKAKEAFRMAQELAVENAHQNISPLHLFAALVFQEEGLVQPVLHKLGVDPSIIYDQVINIISNRSSNLELEDSPIVHLYPTPELAQVLEKSGKIASSMSDAYISTEHLLISVLEKPGALKDIIEEFGLDAKKILKIVLNLREGEFEENIQKSSAKTLEKYSINLTELARKNKLDPVIGRDQETNRVIQILSRRTKNNPILIGEAGTGKTAIAEGLAQRIIAGDVPESMREKELYGLDIVSMLAGTKFRGEFEERLKKVMNEVKKNDKFILFIDEIHTLMGTGAADGAMDAANILKPALARGQIRVIGATTLKEYQHHIEKDGALTRRFQPVYIAEPSIEDAISILRGLRERYEVFHGIRITDEAIVSAVQLSSRYITERYLPDKAIDLIDESASLLRVSLENKPEELDIAHRDIRRYEIELEAVKKDYETNKNIETKQKIKKTEKSIANIKESTRNLELRWKNEKETIELIKKLQIELEENKHAGEKAESMADYTLAAEIRYTKIPKIEADFKKAQTKLKKLQKTRKILREEVTSEDVANIIARWTGIPASKMLESEIKRLSNMESALKKKVIGQNDAVEKISSAIKRSRAGISDPTKPIGSFLFLGPTGVGKTELAKQLAKYMFDDEKSLVRFDMSEYMERHTVSKLIGAPPGYVGHEEAGKLTEMIRHRPYSIILFDEIEKAHPDVFNILLQLLDDGILTDSKGRTVNFKNTIIILTSNIGSEQIAGMSSIGFEESIRKSEQIDKEYKDVKNKVMLVLQKTFKPEFLNRLDEVIVFRPLQENSIRKIVFEILERSISRLAEKQITVEVEKKVSEKLAKDGYNNKFGARPLQRKIQTDILNPLANAIIDGTLKKGSTVTIGVKDNEYTFKTKNRANSKKEKSLIENK